SPRHHRRRTSFRKGSQLWVQIRPYVTEDEGGPAEVADLVFEDGTTVSQVPFACFSFVDSGRAPPAGGSPCPPPRRRAPTQEADRPCPSSQAVRAKRSSWSAPTTPWGWLMSGAPASEWGSRPPPG